MRTGLIRRGARGNRAVLAACGSTTAARRAHDGAGGRGQAGDRAAESDGPTGRRSRPRPRRTRRAPRRSSVGRRRSLPGRARRSLATVRLCRRARRGKGVPRSAPCWRRERPRSPSFRCPGRLCRLAAGLDRPPPPGGPRLEADARREVGRRCQSRRGGPGDATVVHRFADRKYDLDRGRRHLPGPRRGGAGCWRSRAGRSTGRSATQSLPAPLDASGWQGALSRRLPAALRRAPIRSGVPPPVPLRRGRRGAGGSRVGAPRVGRARSTAKSVPALARRERERTRPGRLRSSGSSAGCGRASVRRR